MIFLYFFNLAFAQYLILSPDASIQTSSKFANQPLFSSKLLKTYSPAGIQDEILKISEDFLNLKISESVYFLSVRKWSTKGLSDSERLIILDTVIKSEAQIEVKKEWRCQLGELSFCEKKGPLPVLPSSFTAFDWVLIGGVPYALDRWDTIVIGDFETRFVFISSKYRTLDIISKPSELQLASIPLVPWVSGTCESYQVDPEVQSLETSVYFNESCLKTTIPKPETKVTFYKKHEKKIWWTLFGVAILGAVSASGKKIVFTF